MLVATTSSRTGNPANPLDRTLSFPSFKSQVDVFEQMARTAHTRGLQGACWNAVVVRCLTFKDERRAQQALGANW